jgi:molybdopterin-guanine dinucleotide biosynthesis protein B
MLSSSVPVIGFAAFSGAGKTTLLANIIPILVKNNLRPGLIKHSHHNFDIDKPGKDSYKLRSAGASPVLLVSKYRRAIISDFIEPREPRLIDQLNAIDKTQLDLILVEGFKSENFPKIEVHRPELKKPLLFPDDPSIIAIASSVKLKVPEYLQFLDLNTPETIATFIMTEFMEKTGNNQC